VHVGQPDVAAGSVQAQGGAGGRVVVRGDDNQTCRGFSPGFLIVVELRRCSGDLPRIAARG